MTAIALILLAALAFLAAGLWIPFVIGGAAIAVIIAKKGLAGLSAVGLVTWSSANSFTLTAIPLFILMAEILLQTGLASRLYRGLAHATSRLPGGLMQTNIVGCALFSAISGSSVATAASIGTVALPELASRGYPMRMAYGSLAAGGTLGILIPPSIALIIYGTFTDSSIVRLFAAGLIPGLVLALMFSLFVGLFGGGRGRQPSGEDEDAGIVATTIDVLPVMALIVLVLCSLYLGIATPTEAAAVGSVLAFILAALFGDFSWSALKAAFHNSIRASAAILFIVVAAFLFSFALAISGVSGALTAFILSLGLGKAAFLASVAVLYLILGLFIESIAMMVITVPLLAQTFSLYAIDPIWFGVFLVILIEIGQITPPFGLNLFVIQSLNKAPYADVVLGAVPYYAILLGFLVLLVLFPSLALWLPGLIS
ncbi:MAG: TRAP transporter large permease [Alphaproteobacteria bacterium]